MWLLVVVTVLVKVAQGNGTTGNESYDSKTSDDNPASSANLIARNSFFRRTGGRSSKCSTQDRRQVK